MDAEQFDDLIRRWAWRVSRRGMLRFVAGAAGGSLLLTGEAAAARKRRKKRRNNKGNDKGNNFKGPPPPTCAESCTNTCPICVAGPGAPTRCARGVENLDIFCSISCDSDSYCQTFRPDYPYCVSQWLNRATGQVTKASDGCAGVAPPSVAYCSQIDPCA